ncbi:MAG: 2-oxoacid:acceptor oxidoreductase family protein, partial [Nitrospirota bacterium]
IAEELGDNRVVNMIALGAFIKRTGIIKMENLLDALKDILPAKRQSLLELNYEAIKRGASVIKEKAVLKV